MNERAWTEPDREELRQLTDVLPVLEAQARQWKAAYYRACPGVSYEDVQEAVRRLLRARSAYERATGRTVRSDPTSTAQVATLLRSL